MPGTDDVVECGQLVRWSAGGPPAGRAGGPPDPPDIDAFSTSEVYFPFTPWSDHGRAGADDAMHWRDQRIPHTRYDKIQKRFPRYLPHWDLKQGTFFLTWRLFDSVPKIAREELRLEGLEVRQRLLESDLGPQEKNDVLRQFEERYDHWLDKGCGSCWLMRSEVADMVVENLQYHDRSLYRIIAWVVMPNHVHAILRFLGTATLGRVMHSLKSYTSKEANKILQRSGTFWQPDYFDRIIRSDADLMRRVDYVVRNPVKAGLENWKYVGVEQGEVESCRMLMRL